MASRMILIISTAVWTLQLQNVELVKSTKLEKIFSLPFLTTESRQERAEGNLKAICRGDHTVGLLSSVKDLHEFNEALDRAAGEVGCSEFASGALRALGQITASPEACSLTKAEALAAYSQNFLKRKDLLPHALYRFAVAYGMEMSRICKHHLLHNWLEKAEEVTLDYHFQVLYQWTYSGSAVSRLLEPLLKHGDFLLPHDLWSALPDGRVKHKLTLKTTQSDHINRAKKVCSERFAPLYEPIVMPLAALARSGFDYKDIVLKEEQVLYSKRRRIIDDWSKVVFVCEILRIVDYVESQPGHEKLSADETKATRKEKRFRFHQSWIERYESDAIIDEEAKVFNELNLPLVAAVLRFNPKTHAVDRLRAKILKRSWRLLPTNFRYGQFKAMMRAFFKLMSSKFQSHDSVDKDQNLQRRHEEQLEMINESLILALESKRESRIFRFVEGVVNFGKAVVGGAIHFIITVSLLIASLALVCFPARWSDKVKNKFYIMVE